MVYKKRNKYSKVKLTRSECNMILDHFMSYGKVMPGQRALEAKLERYK